MKCLNCGKEFEAKTSRAKYCSNSCRALYLKGVAQPLAQPVAQPTPEIVAQPADLEVAQPNPDKYHCTPEELDLLPAGVTRPDKVGVKWSFDGKYHKIIHDLIHLTYNELTELKAFIPCWRQDIRGSLV